MSKKTEIIFHLAFPIDHLQKAKKFYQDGLGCKVGRESNVSIIFNLAGHQIVAQLTKEKLNPQKGIYPRHFGLIFPIYQEWEKFLKRAKKKKLKFYQKEKVRYPNSPLEHHTFFLQDPSYNLLEFKFYKFPSAIFGSKKFKKVGEEVR